MLTERIKPCGARAPKVLVYMLDAARADVVEAVNSSIWRKLKENRWADGYHSAWSLTAEIEPYSATDSGSNHTTIATGMLTKNHHVINNDVLCSFNSKATPTWMERINRKFPKLDTVFALSWVPDLALVAESTRWVFCGTEDANNHALVTLLNRPASPSALLVFDGDPDHTGHNSCFYPYSDEYLKAVENAMARFGKLLDTIKASQNFAAEDWLIVLCADHGGMGSRHGMSGGQASNVPLMYCGKAIPEGIIHGRPGTVDIAAQVLHHFGMDDEVAELDGQGGINAEPPRRPRPFAENLLYDLSVVNGNIVNTAAETNAYTTHGEMHLDTGNIDISCGYVTLDALNDRTGSAFSFSMKFSGDISKEDGVQVIFSNKDCSTATNPGFALMVEKGVFFPMSQGKNRITFHAGCKNAPRTYVNPKSDRMNLGDVLVGDGEETILAVSIDPAGMVTIFQRSLDSGQSYWFCNDAKGIRPISQQPWNIGQDGTGKFKKTAPLKISNFRFWNRALTLEELRRL